MTLAQVLDRLEAEGRPENVAGMARFGIRPRVRVLGITLWQLRRLARQIGRDHRLAQRLWASGIHEARLLASFVDEPERVTERQMERWVRDFDSWDICDQVTGLFAQTPPARRKALEWSRRPEEFVKRAGFAMMAELAWYGRAMADADFEPFLAAIAREADDDRNFVKKAVNWALRNIGKRGRALNRRALALAKEMRKMDSKAARWIASDAMRELASQAVRDRLDRRAARRAPAGRMS